MSIPFYPHHVNVLKLWHTIPHFTWLSKNVFPSFFFLEKHISADLFPRFFSNLSVNWKNNHGKTIEVRIKFFLQISYQVKVNKNNGRFRRCARNHRIMVVIFCKYKEENQFKQVFVFYRESGKGDNLIFLSKYYCVISIHVYFKK